MDSTLLIEKGFFFMGGKFEKKLLLRRKRAKYIKMPVRSSIQQVIPKDLGMVYFTCQRGEKFKMLNINTTFMNNST